MEPILTWPPTLDMVRNDIRRDDPDVALTELDKERLRSVLQAATRFVLGIHQDRYNFTGDLGSPLPEPPEDIVLGTIRLAGRWHTRRRSPDALIEMGEMGTSRVPSIDPDIDRMLKLGRHTKPQVG